jgi:hypothetical protein
MQIDIEIPIHVRSAIEQHTGVSLEDMAAQLIQTRVNRLFNLYRPRKPAGRPKLDEQAQKFRDLAKKLTDIFTSLREVGPDDFEIVYGDLYQTLTTAIAERNLPALEWFVEYEPWRSNPAKPLITQKEIGFDNTSPR